MNFLLHGLTLALAWFLAVNVLASALVAWQSTRRPPTQSPAYWFMLRIVPGWTAMLFVASVFLPSHWRYEPREAAEGFAVTLTSCAIVACGLLAAAAVRGLNAWRRASARTRAWMRSARPLTLSGTEISAFEVDRPHPFMALAGVLRPRLLVTRGLIEALSAEELSACIVHEVGHCRARDNLKRLAMRASPDALFATSTARAIERRWAAASEHAADDTAGHHGMAARCALASALVKVARLIPEDRVLAEPISTLIGGGEITARVRRLLDDRPLAPAVGRPAVRAGFVGGMVAVAAMYGPLLQIVHHATELLVHSLP
jgi:Zn-dependent protease with chaperone function